MNPLDLLKHLHTAFALGGALGLGGALLFGAFGVAELRDRAVREAGTA